MLNSDLYTIYTEKSEYRGTVDELFSSFEEAMANRFKYANWWRPSGDVWIYKYAAGSTGTCPSEEWHVREDGHAELRFKWEIK